MTKNINSLGEATVTLTERQLREAFLQWEAAYRAGATRTVEEMNKLSAEECADISAAHFWRLLVGVTREPHANGSGK